MKPFRSYSDDVLWKFKIKDWFDSEDPVARSMLRLLAADADLSNIERFKEILETEEPGEQTDEITRTKWKKTQFFLLKLRLGFLHNVFEEIIGYDKNKKSIKVKKSLDKLVNSNNPKVQKAYKELKITIEKYKTTMKVINDFRNQVSFHYVEGSFQTALKLVEQDTGEMIVNPTEMDLHSIVVDQVLEVIPCGRLLKSKVMKIKEEVELLQAKLHTFTFELFDEYFMSRCLIKKTNAPVGF